MQTTPSPRPITRAIAVLDQITKSLIWAAALGLAARLVWAWA
jgi:hypothetical protein